MTELFTELCTKCRGKGVRWFGTSEPVPCVPCEGTGQRTFKSCPEYRARTNANHKLRKERKLKAAISTFQTEHADIWTWMETADAPFAGKMREALMKWGGLTDNQLAASVKCAGRKYGKAKLL